MAEFQLPAKNQSHKGNCEQYLPSSTSQDGDQQRKLLERFVNGITISSVDSGLHNKNIPGLLGTMQAYFRRDEDCYRQPFQDADKFLDVLQCKTLAELCLELLHISASMDGAARMVDAVLKHDNITPDKEPLMLRDARNHLRTAVIQLDYLAVNLRDRLAGQMKTEGE